MSTGGPLAGIKVLEFASLGPGPMAAMLLADLGAEVLRIERQATPGAPATRELFAPEFDVTRRSRRIATLNLKRPGAIAAALRLAARADVLVEGFRPGVMEKLGLGPNACFAANPRLVYGRMTGWGQFGPLSQTAGHDINYMSLSGALAAIGPPQKPFPPLNLVADAGGGAMLLALGVVAALHAVHATGRGQVVDAAMSDGSALMMSMVQSLKAMGDFQMKRASNWLDGGAYFYDTYCCADGKWLSVGAIESQFHAELLQKLGLAVEDFAGQWERDTWAQQRARLAAVFMTRTRDAWCAEFAGSDACVAPVLDMDEAPLHPHNQARGTFVELDGIVQAAPAPRFSATPCPPPRVPTPVEFGEQVLADWGLDQQTLAALRENGAL
ncbi:MAG: CoA transferase [Rhodocyclaceae bacterium]|nr:CoA transferase [Rhodocyclaceae bacterium]MBX3668220.1 CoA transferase [Rhodocyclaceae bacterium]